MNNNFKFLGVLALIGLAMFGYERYETQQRQEANSAFSERLKQLNNNGNEIPNPASQSYDPNVITNYPFGVNIPIVADLKMLPTASKNSYYFVDARTESRSDFIIVMPVNEELNTIIQNLQTSGTPYSKIENGVFTSINENGMTMNMIYNSSPNGGGLSIIRVVTGFPTISQQTIDALFNGIRFMQSTASLEERQQLLEIDAQNLRIANQRDEVNRRSATDGDLLTARVEGMMSRCYACEGGW